MTATVAGQVGAGRVTTPRSRPASAPGKSCQISPCRRIGGPMMPDRLLDAAEVADLLAVPVSWVRETTRAGRMPYVQLGRYVRYQRADVLAWLDTCRSPGSAATFRTVVPRRGA